MRIVFDLESDGLLYDATTIWCISTQDIDSGDHKHFGPDEIEEGVAYLQEADLLIGHNICGFDIPLMEKFGAPYFDRKKLRDTYVMSKLFYPNKPHHSLESWGEILGEHKVEHEDWSQYSEAMRKRCDVDVFINSQLYDRFVERECKKWPAWLESIILEGEMHYWQAYQELYGVGFDKRAAEELVRELDAEIAMIDKILDKDMPVYCKQVGATVLAPFKKDGTYKKIVEDWFATDTI